MMPNLMTFDQFIATKKWSDDLSDDVGDARWDDDPVKPTGWVYCDGLSIDSVMSHWPDDAKARGSWYLLLERDEWITDDLADLERRLYDWACSAGYCDL